MASRSVLEDFTDDALTISAGSLFQNGIALMAMVAATSLFVELISVAAKPLACWMREGGLHGEFQKTVGDLEHGY